MADAAKLEELTGIIQNLKCERPTFCAGTIHADGRPVSFSVRGFVKSGDCVTLVGAWEDSPKWGRQFKAREAHVALPVTPAGLVQWLAWNVLRVGPVTAQRLVDEFGVELMDRCASDPESVAIFSRLPLSTVEQMAGKWASEKQRVGAFTYFAALGLTKKQCDTLLETVKSGSVQLVDEDPYRLIGLVSGFGWGVVDALAAKLNVTGTDPRRLRGALTAITRESEDEGSTAVNVATACRVAADKLGVRDPNVIAAVVQGAVERGDVRRFGGGTDETDFLATPHAHKQEEFIWRILAHMKTEANPYGYADDAKVCEIAEEYRTLDGITFDDYQLEAVKNAIRHRVSVVTGSAGAGKCLGRGTLVMLHCGKTIPAEEIQVDDLLMGPDSQPRRVLSTSCGRGPLYRITPIKGQPWVCNDVHVLTLKGTNAKAGKIVDVPLNEYLASVTCRPDRDWKLFRVPVEYDQQPVPFDPYLVGAWIGDGVTTQPVIHLGPKKTAVLNYIVQVAIKIGMNTHIRDDGHRTAGLQVVSVITAPGHHGKPNPFRQYILNACQTSGGDKIIPDCYLFNSREIRLQMLAALLDTDGSLQRSGYDWVSKSQQLAEQVVRLCRSLGFAAYMRTKEVQLKTWDSPRTYYRVSISGNMSEVPCKVESKQANDRRQIKDHLVTGWTADPIGNGEYFGFTLDGDGRFLLGDFTVTHNTSIARAIVKFFQDGDVPVRLAAPTGKAAKRMREVIGHDAETIHRLLEFNGGTKHFARDRLNPLQNCAILLDEASMISSDLLYRVLAAMGAGTALVLIGDPNQLPPVDAGAPLRDILAHELAPATRLEKVHRQAGYLKTNCTAILAGKVEPNVTDESPSPWVVEARATSAEIASKLVADLYAKYLPKWNYDPIRDAQFMTAKHDGAYGTKKLNLLLQRLHQASLGNTLAEPDPDEHERRPTLYAGDKVVQDRNDYDLEVFNGDIGVVVEVAPTRDDGDKPYADLIVKFGEREVTYPIGTGGNVSLAYCLTGHRMQGSQVPCAIVLVPKSHGFMMNRNWLYTCATRAQKTAVILGDPEGIRRAAEKQVADARVTVLRVLSQHEAARPPA